MLEAVVETAISKREHSLPSRPEWVMPFDNRETIAESVLNRKGNTISQESNRQALLAAQAILFRCVSHNSTSCSDSVHRPENEIC